LEAALDTVLDYIQWLVASRASSTSS